MNAFPATFTRLIRKVVGCFFLIGLLTGPCVSARAKEPKRTVVDYYLLLPADTFEGSAAGWLRYLRQPKCGLVDIKNGYMSCTGDGAQPGFEVALFRYADGRPLLALCTGELEGPDSVYLTFYELGPDGRMRPLPRSIFPIKDSLKNLRFDLPREGRTIQVREAKTNQVRSRVTWNGEKFQVDK